MDKLLHTTLGQYRIDELVGRGSTSSVYKSYQPALNRYVAIKVLLRHLDANSESRFRQEAQAIGRLQHPNILPIYDFAQQDGLHYFVMQYVENGGTLADTLTGTPLPPLIALPLMQHLLSALEYAHTSGIIHRDIKPSNILMLRPDWPVLADFGIAKIIDDNQGLTPSGHAVGTAAYMAPERATAQPADARSDLYAAGVVLYEMVTGRVPFDAVTPMAMLIQHIHEPLPPPRDLNPDLPRSVEIILLRALAKNPDHRYQHAAEMAADVQRVIAELERAPALSQPTNQSVAAGQQLRTPVTSPLALDPLPAHLPHPPAAVPEAPQPQQSSRRRRALLGLMLAILGAATVLIVAGMLPGVFVAAPTVLSEQVPASEVVPPDQTASSLGDNATPANTDTATPRSTVQAPTPVQPNPQPTEDGLYVVLPGDTLSDIAAASGTTVDALLAANSLSDPNAIQAGQQLVLPKPGQTIAPTASASQSPKPQATRVPIASPTQVARTAIPATQSGTTRVQLAETDWQGGWQQSRPYGGRRATWIYGSSTAYGSMATQFELPEQPAGIAQLGIEGMDSEGADKTPILIRVNGTNIYSGPNPLPNDDIPLETGTWATYTFTFDAALLQPGRNEIRIDNLAPGAFSSPPFFMLDYAELAFDTSPNP